MVRLWWIALWSLCVLVPASSHAKDQTSHNGRSPTASRPNGVAPRQAGAGNGILGRHRLTDLLGPMNGASSAPGSQEASHGHQGPGSHRDFLTRPPRYLNRGRRPNTDGRWTH
jgi:hypothetical protein